MEKLWGIDLGGTKIEGVVISADNYEHIHVRKRIPTEANKGYEHTLNRIKLLVNSIAEEEGSYPDKLGMGTPGSIDPESGLLKNSNSWALNDRPLKEDIEDLLGIPVEMANDANCFVLAETRLGVVKKEFPEARVVFGIIMGTGCGGGIVVNGQVLNGHLGITGEWGHNYLDDSGGICYCGKTGCTEMIISGPALENFYERMAGKRRSMKEVYQLYKDGNDKIAQDTMERLFHFFGKGISVVINILDPDVIVVGGGVGNIPELYTLGKSRVGEFVFNPTFNTPIVRPILGDSAGVFGATMLVS